MSLSFFTRALRLSITVIALIGFYLPMFKTTRGATAGLIVACVSTSIWYILNNPYGIDNMYIAAISPVLVMALDRLVSSERPHIEPTPYTESER